MATKLTFSRLSERIFAVRAAWRRQIPLRVRVEAVRDAAAAGPGGNRVPVIVRSAAEDGPNRVESPTQPSLIGAPPVRRVTLSSRPAQVA